VLAAWERALAATAIAHANSLVSGLEQASEASANYSFADQAEHFGALKGVALSFQFYQGSQLSAGQFAALHRFIGVRPAVPDALPPSNAAALAAYGASLREAVSLLRAVYDFDATVAERWR
jgi:hypothetical protein